MSKLIKELTKEWKEYKKLLQEENMEILRVNMEADKEAKRLNQNVREKVANNPYCPVTIPFNDSIFARHLPFKELTMEGFMDYLSNKK